MNFKDTLTIDNNKYLKWLDSTGTTRSNIIVLDSNNNVNIKSALGNDLYINSNNSGSNTYINNSNTKNVIVSSKLAVGISATENINANLTLSSNGFIGINTTQGSNDGYLGLVGSSVLNNQQASRIILQGIDVDNGNLKLYSANNTSASINFYNENDSLKMQIKKDGSYFTPDGSTIRASISDSETIITNKLYITDTTPSINGSTGAVIISGGIGVIGNCYVDGTLSINSVSGNINFDSSVSSTSYTTGAIYISGGLGISNTTDAFSVTSGGAISIAGGLAVGKNSFIGGSLTIDNTIESTNSLNGCLILQGGLGINSGIYSRTNSSNIKLAPLTNNEETSILFYSNNSFTNGLTGGSSTWTIGQGVGTIGNGKFGIYSINTGTIFTASYNGYIGISNTDPQYTLDVNGTIYSDNITTNNLINNYSTLSNTLITNNTTTNFGSLYTTSGNSLITNNTTTNLVNTYSSIENCIVINNTVTSFINTNATITNALITNNNITYNTVDNLINNSCTMSNAIINNSYVTNSTITNFANTYSSTNNALITNNNVTNLINTYSTQINALITNNTTTNFINSYSTISNAIITSNTCENLINAYSTTSNAFITNNTSTNINTTNLTVLNINTTNLTASNINIPSLNTANVISTNITTTNISITNIDNTYSTITNMINNYITSGSIIINSTNQSGGIGSGGSLTVLGGASFSKDVYVGGTLASASDIRLKENIIYLKKKNVLDTIDNIRTIRYNYIKSFDNELVPQIGFIAQDFEEDYPELIRKNKEGYYSLDYQKITVILLECIKELKAKIK